MVIAALGLGIDEPKREVLTALLMLNDEVTLTEAQPFPVPFIAPVQPACAT
jgi:hypothetical protein